MRADRLAHAVTSVLIPALPSLVRENSRIQPERGSARGQKGLARQLWTKLRSSIEHRVSAREALEDVAREPEDWRASGALELQLEKILSVDGHLAAEVDRLLGEADAEKQRFEPLRREEEIESLYRELRNLMGRADDGPGVEAQIASRLTRLRQLQKEEAAEMRASIESQFHLKPGEGWEALREARRLLSRDEDPSSADAATKQPY